MLGIKSVAIATPEIREMISQFRSSRADFIEERRQSMTALSVGGGASALSSYDDEKIKLAARRFVDTIKSVVYLGPKQADACLRIVKAAYNRAAGTAPDIEDVLSIAEELYEEEEKQPDLLLVTLRDFADFPIFRS